MDRRRLPGTVKRSTALAVAFNDETTKLHKTGQWTKALSAVKLTDASDVPLREPRRLCR